MTDGIGDALRLALGADRVRRAAGLASLTTFRAGGPAEWLFETGEVDEVVQAIEVAHDHGLAVTVLGGGSNVLIGDLGILGLVIHVRGGRMEAIRPEAVRAGSGVTINGLVRWTINRGLAGLERWAGTPGTVGGAVYGNAHFDGRLIGDVVSRVSVATSDGAVRELKRSAMEFGYDRSRLQRTREVLLWAEFAVRPGEPAALRRDARASLAFRKRTQPLAAASAGCVFQNPDPESVPAGMPASAGALIEAAGLKDRAIGGARVSPTHGNFIINDGEATAADIRTLVTVCQQVVAARFGVQLREEVVYLGEF